MRAFSRADEVHREDGNWDWEKGAFKAGTFEDGTWAPGKKPAALEGRARPAKPP